MKQVSGILPALMMLLISLPVSANADETYDAQGCEGWRRGGGAKTMAPACRNGDRARIKATHARDRLIVKLRSDTPPERVAHLHAMAGGHELRKFASLPGLSIVGLREAGLEESLAAYRTAPEVLYAEPDYVVHAYGLPNDPLFPDLWGLHNTGQEGGVSDADINAPEAWEVTVGSGQIVAAIIDSGIDYNHPDLAAALWVNAGEIAGNGLDDDGNGWIDDVHGINTITGSGDPLDDNGHGTHVAGTIAATGNNQTGVIGVAFGTKLLACKFLGSGALGYASDAVTCLDYLYQLKTRSSSPVNIVVSNNSWGGGGPSQAVSDAIARSREAGMLFVAASGNSRSNNDYIPDYPSAYGITNIISVAATARTDELARFSSYGSRTVHLGAPGVDISSTVPGGSYESSDGTSMAAPHVTGVIALLAAHDPTRDWRALRNLTLAGGKPSAATAGKTITGRTLRAIDASGVGSLSCSGQKVSRRITPLSDETSASMSDGVDLAVININCASPAGEITVEVSDGSVVLLTDDGQGSDQAAGDGVYAGTFLPSDYGTYELRFGADDVVMVKVLRPYAPPQEVAYKYRKFKGTSLYLGDNYGRTINVPFPIALGGAAPGLSHLTISDNGMVTVFDLANASLNEPLPTAAFSVMVAPYWDNLDPMYSNGNVFWTVLGTAPNRELVIEWRDLLHISSFESFSFQVVFFEGSSDVLFNYADVYCGYPDCDKGISATVGIQIAPGVAQQYSYNSPLLHDRQALLWQLATRLYANAGPDQLALPGDIVVLDGASSVSPAGIVSHHWRQMSGPMVTLSDANSARPYFVAPGTSTLLTFELKVADKDNATAFDEAAVRTNVPPVADAGPDLFVRGTTLTVLDGSGSYDTDGNIVHYHWDQTWGTPVTLVGADTAVATFAGPAANDFLMFRLTVTDDAGALDQDAVSVPTKKK